MGDPLKKVQAGQQLAIPAEAYNAFIDAALGVRGRRHDQGQQPAEVFRQSGIVLVRNDSGADLARLSVLGIDHPIVGPSANLDEFKSKVNLAGSTPQLASHFGRFVILLDPLAAGAIGRAYVAGVCPVLVEVSDAAHRFADVDDDNASGLVSAEVGAAQILWRESGLGTKWAVVRLGPPVESQVELVRFTLNEDIGQTLPGQAAADKLTLAGVDTGLDITVLDPAGLFVRALDTAQGIAVQVDGAYYVLVCQTKAGKISCTATGNMTDGAIDAAVDFWWGSQQDVQNPDPGEERITVLDTAGLFKRMQEGASFLAALDVENDVYEIIEGQSLAGVIECTANEDMGATAANQVQATLDRWWGSQQDIQEPQGTILAHDEGGVFPFLKSGDFFFAVLDAEENKYRIIYANTADSFLGVLDEDLTRDGDADVSIWESGADTGVNINAKDFFLKNADDIVPSGTRVWIKRFRDGDWYVMGGACGPRS